jgi:hypothetical protein
MYPPIATALRMGAAFALTVLLILASVYALFGGAAAVASYSLAKFGHLLVMIGEFGGSVFLGALGGAAMAGPARHVGWKSASLAGIACFVWAFVVGTWYQATQSPDALYPPSDQTPAILIWFAGNAILFAFAVTRLRGVTDND